MWTQIGWYYHAIFNIKITLLTRNDIMQGILTSILDFLKSVFPTLHEFFRSTMTGPILVVSQWVLHIMGIITPVISFIILLLALAAAVYSLLYKRRLYLDLKKGKVHPDRDQDKDEDDDYGD